MPDDYHPISKRKKKSIISRSVMNEMSTCAVYMGNIFLGDGTGKPLPDDYHPISRRKRRIINIWNMTNRMSTCAVYMGNTYMGKQESGGGESQESQEG